MKICVLNASNPGATLSLEADSYVSYKEGRQSCFNGQEVLKQCRSWHGWTYALETEFFVYGKDKWQGCYQYDGIIILVNRDIEQLLPLVKKLKLMKKKVAISFHEGCQDLITSSGVQNENLTQRWIGLYDLVMAADFYLNIFGQMTDFFEGWFGKDKVRFANHCAPMDWNHGINVRKNEKKGILIGTRTFNQRLSRNTFITLGALNRSYDPITFISEDGDVGPLLKRIGMENINVLKGPLSWVDWLKLVAKHEMIVSMDHSLNLGQVYMDAAMVDTIPVGGTTWFSELMRTGDKGSARELLGQIENAFDFPTNAQTKLQTFKLIIDPNCVKYDLQEAFK
jgi:hypothetical protein